MGLPDFKPGMRYLVRGSTLNDILTEVQTNRPCCVQGGGLTICDSTEKGTFIVERIRVPEEGPPVFGGGGSTPDPADEMPDFDDDKFYFLTAATFAKFLAAAKRNHARVASGNGLSVVSDAADGITLKAV